MSPPLSYLDNAANAPLRPEAWEAMAPYYQGGLGNPSGSHRAARTARDALEGAREVIAGVCGVDPVEVVFTSGGTESDNAAIFGAVRAGYGIALCSAAEHHAVIESVRAAGGEIIPVTSDGAIDLDALAGTLDATAGIVSVMAVNNEVGTVSDLGAVARLVARHAPQALLHTDAVQAACGHDVAEICSHGSVVSLSSHKAGGPVGVGVLIVKRGVELSPFHLGGSQELGRRAGTQDVASAIGMAAAFAAAGAKWQEEAARLRRLRDALADEILSCVPDAIETVSRGQTSPSHCHVLLPGTNSEEVLFLLDEAGICASAASSCASGASEPSHVLAAMGIDPALATGGIRFSLGWATGEDDVQRVAEVIGPIVAKARS